ncbi:hypothetical protein [Novosphingobium sp. FKTRR1]|uniref:hypothetical protein n=1 Tax=Novosphingobium sp. FKTRR1 TaxID=2879118 RepID=UPI001CEFD70C|nr:hypothetical protein [Novosphingobium sp. FKTRR1]
MASAPIPSAPTTPSRPEIFDHGMVGDHLLGIQGGVAGTLYSPVPLSFGDLGFLDAA